MVQTTPTNAVGGVSTRLANLPPTGSQQINTDALPAIVPLLAPTGEARHDQGSSTQQRLRNLQRSNSVSSLPNPYDVYDPERTLPPAPPSDSNHSHNHSSEYAALLALAASSPTSPTETSHPPSSYVAPTDLSRGSTHASSSSRLSTSSLLHSEIQTYQKRLEAHHEKELAARGEPSISQPGYPVVPSDPPPMYTENLHAASSTSDT